MSVTEAIRVLDGTHPTNLTEVQRMMLFESLNIEANKGDVRAKQFIWLCNCRPYEMTRH